MATLSIIGFTVLNLLIIDMLVCLLVRHTRKTSSYKPAGLLALFMLALAPTGTVLLERSYALTRFFLSLAASIFLSGVIGALLSSNSDSSEEPAMLVLSLMPFLVMPFCHLIFGLIGGRPLALMASIKNFRLRGTVALVMSANLVLSSLGSKDNMLVWAIHALFAFLGVVNVFYLLSCLRAKSTFFTIDSEDSDTGAIGFFYYLCALLELLFYCVVLHLEVLSHLWSFWAPELGEVSRTFASMALLYLASFVVAKLFMIQRNTINLDFYERGILPGSFLFFAVALIAEHYW